MTAFQTFDDPSERAASASRIAALRAALAARSLAGFVVPRADEHQSEYLPPHAERLPWLTGFTGSAGTAIVLADALALVVDGRYTLQAAEQTDPAVTTVVKLAESTPEAWIEANLPAGGALGYDPWLHTPDGVKRLKKAAEAAGGRLEPVENPVDAVRPDRPAPPSAPVRPHPQDFAGETAAAKIGRAQEALAKARCDALVVSDPHNLAWLLNLRGGDVSHTPLPLGYVLLPHEGRPTLFLDPAKMTNAAGDALAPVADVAAPDALPAALDALARGKTIRIDAATGASALAARVEAAGGTADVGADPITAMKARKNAAEIAGARAAQARDAAAFARFLAWFSVQPPGSLTEIAAVERLEAFRTETGRLKELAFPTISGSGPNGALPHYRVTRGSDRTMGAGELLVLDSGAQYEDGTTDITRTLPVGAPTPEMRDRYTRVLRGHIAIARAVFPKGTSGAQIDALARLPLWEAGLDFDHGTGHGVGSFLSVHEGPQRIAKTGHAALEPGMIVSNEPGYYKLGAYGIRLENLVLVEERAVPGAERPMLGFETLTLAPFDSALIDPAAMRTDEVAWLDAYHARVREVLSPLVDPATRDWLARATRPLGG